MEEEQVISRKQALKLNLEYYFTGKACRRGHMARRTTKKSECIECRKIAKQSHYQNNKNEYDRRHQEWKSKNSARHKTNQQKWRTTHRQEMREYHTQWRDENREHYNDKQSSWARNNKIKRTAIMARYRENILVKISQNLRSRLNRAIKSGAKTGSAVRDLGCSIQECRNYITSLFTTEMTWENWGRVWQLDHIRPLMNFDLRDRDQLREVCHYTNLQPLLIEDHREKTKIDLRNKRGR